MSTVRTNTSYASARALPGEETQTKLNALSDQFNKFFGDLGEETAVRKKAEESRFARVERELGRLEKAVNVETRRRIESTKAIQQQFEERLEELQNSFRAQIKTNTDDLQAQVLALNAHVAVLEVRMDEERENREREIQRHNKDVLEKFDAHTKEFEIEKVTRLEREAQLLKRVGDEAFRVQQKIAQEHIHRDGEIVQMKDEFWAATKGRDKADEVFKSEMLRKMAVVQRSLNVETKAREVSEEQLVNAINDYTKALQDGLKTINRTRAAE
ncbi:SF-assemblin/beta giardin-domain-containing protein [Pavlovales sp. CCMP2436]|nr:SF-assemblin/beta giardin-domain-containing protein [Pavlovales sp. CCMP2436]|mmetsp:Transcript_13422/g.34233  ORF Transcript_13422/g.34233 Transcript_13422/m.34233 type:complete len:271 (-) Transcript_13422:54-866(-)